MGRNFPRPNITLTDGKNVNFESFRSRLSKISLIFFFRNVGLGSRFLKISGFFFSLLKREVGKVSKLYAMKFKYNLSHFTLLVKFNNAKSIPLKGHCYLILNLTSRPPSSLIFLVPKILLFLCPFLKLLFLTPNA